MSQQIGFHEKTYDRPEVLKIINHVIGSYKRIPERKVKNGFKFKDKFSIARLTVEGVLDMAEVVINHPLYKEP